MNPFEYVKAINSTKEDIMVDDITEKQYNAFIINRSLSQFADTTLLANEMNIHHHLDSRLQFSFLLNTVRKKNRFAKWAKQDSSSDLEAVKTYYGYSNEKARSALTVLTHEQLEQIKVKVNKGGRK